MPVLVEAFLSPRSVQNSVSTRFRQRKSLCIAPEIPFSSASRIPKHILRASPISIPSHRRYFLGFLSNTVTFQNT